MRLLSGLLAGQSFSAELVGDDSLTRRPMRRITEPLRRMGAVIETSSTGTAPLRIGVAPRLRAIEYSLPVASAQVKSCLLLAGLYAAGWTRIIEPATTRDHTERMLRAFGYPVAQEGSRISLAGGGELAACSIEVPADISSAAFFLVGASIARRADLLLTDVGVNPTRTGVIEILRLMGADITLSGERWAGGEPVADIRVRSARLRGISIPPALVPVAIDEFPALFIAAACAAGETVLTGAAELRVKESDRIQTMADGLQALGVHANPLADGIVIRGGSGFTGGDLDSGGDHRVAMAFAMAALRAEGELRVRNCSSVATSFPNFAASARHVGLALSELRPEAS
jgi:3-phosphoshikimate 1-carboxyvinyltransferase